MRTVTHMPHEGTFVLRSTANGQGRDYSHDEVNGAISQASPPDRLDSPENPFEPITSSTLYEIPAPD